MIRNLTTSSPILKMIPGSSPFFASLRPCLAAFVGFTLTAGAISLAQVPDAPAPAAPAAGAPGAAPASGGNAPAAQPAPASAPAASGSKPSNGFLGGDVPHFDPASETLAWDGKTWNVNNNRIFEARFEKYLNAPEETTAEDRRYQAIISEILTRLAPGNATTENLDYSFKLLAYGSNFDVDARLCDSLADAVYTVWMAQRQQQRLVAANSGLDYEQIKLEAEIRHQGKVTEHATDVSQKTQAPQQGGGKNGGQRQNNRQAQQQAADAKQATVEASNWQTRRLAEMIARQKANEVKRELSEIQAKVEYQALIVQFFLQRRFQHVLMATRFYRALFSDGDSKLNLGKDSKDLFTRSAGMAPTVSTLDSLANEAVRDVREGVKAFDFLLDKNELESATKRLAESFTVGEYLPEIRTLPREKKRKTLDFAQKSNQLLSALEVKDYTLAKQLVEELGKTAKDFDNSKPMAAIETARTVSGFHLLKARNAALGGDKQTLESELTQAAEIWPRNPALADVSKMIFDQGDVQLRALTDFDQLLSQKNYRQIYENSARYIAACAPYPDRQKQLMDVLNTMKSIEEAIMRGQEMGKQSNYAGAWESVEKTAQKYPDDSKLNQVRADLTTKAADFVVAIRGAEDLEKKNQVGSSLAWYLKAQKLYPGSDFAEEGIDRLTKRILPKD